MSEEEKEQGLFSDVEGSGSEESEIMRGGPGTEEDVITNPPEVEVGAITKEGEPEKEISESPKQRRFKSWDDAEKAHASAERKMREVFEENARYRQMFSTIKPDQRPAPRPKVWEREKKEFEERVAALPRPDMEDAKAVSAYNEQVKNLYFETHDKYAEIGQQEREIARQQTNQITGWIESEASKWGFTDEPFDLRNEDGTVEKGSLKNVFWSVATNPESFGISIRDANGRTLPLDQQVKAIARGINRFLDSYFDYRINKGKRLSSEKRGLTVLRRGSLGPKKGSGEEEEEISTFADQIKQNMKSRRKAGDLRRRGD
jgi:hypothetical protein